MVNTEVKSARKPRQRKLIHPANPERSPTKPENVVFPCV